VAVLLHSLSRKGALKQELRARVPVVVRVKSENWRLSVKLMLHIDANNCFTFFLLFIVWYKNEHAVLGANLVVAL